MYTLYLAVGIAIVVAVVPLLLGVDAIWTVLPGILIGVGAFVWMNRRVARRVEAVTQAADREMAKMQQVAQRGGPQAQAAMFRTIDGAIEILKKGFQFEKWQVGVTTMLNARIGMMLYTRWLLSQQFGGKKSSADKAGLTASIPYLEKSRAKGARGRLLAALWPAWAMLAVAYYKGNKDIEKSIGVLEDTVKVAKKNGILWCLYAWLLMKEKRRDEAIDVLVRGKAAAENDPHIEDNLTRLQNNKNMNLRPYGEQWYQFGLERPKMAAAQQRMGHPRMRGGGRRR